jgi:hypothetical protein
MCDSRRGGERYGSQPICGKPKAGPSPQKSSRAFVAEAPDQPPKNERVSRPVIRSNGPANVEQCRENIGESRGEASCEKFVGRVSDRDKARRSTTPGKLRATIGVGFGRVLDSTELAEVSRTETLPTDWVTPTVRSEIMLAIVPSACSPSQLCLDFVNLDAGEI